MAQLAIGVGVGLAGQAIGIPFPIGFAVGQFVAGIFLRDDDKGRKPEVTDFEIQSSAYGRPIPQMWGTGPRLAGSIIDAGPVITKTFEERQGKGDILFGPAVTRDEKFMTFAVILVEGEVDLLRVWADKKLLIDLTITGGFTDVGINFTFYRGTETQAADPRLQALHTADKTPAYRGWAYIVFEEFPLSQFGNRIPNLEFEVTSNAVTTFPATTVALPPSPWRASNLSDGIVNWAIDPINPFVYGIGLSGEGASSGYGLAKYDALSGALVSWNGETTSGIVANGNVGDTVSDTGLAIDRLGFIYMGVSALDGINEHVAKIDPNSLTSIDFVPAPGNARTLDWNDIKVGHLAVPGGTLEISDGVFQQVIPYGPFITHSKNGGTVFAIDWGGGTPVNAASSVPMGNMIVWNRSAGDWTGDPIYDFVFDPFGRMWGVGVSTLRLFSFIHDPVDPRLNVVLIQTATFDLSAHGNGFTLLTYDEATHSLIIADTSSSATSQIIKFDLVDKVVTSAFPDLAWISDAPNLQFTWEYGVFRNWMDGKFALKSSVLVEARIYVIDTVTEDVTVLNSSDYGVSFGSGQLVWDSFTECTWANNDDIGAPPQIVCLPLKAGSPVTLRTIVEEISADVGQVVGADNNYTALTDSVRGYIIETRMSAKAAIEALQPGFFFSIVEKDWELVGVKLGGTSSLTIPEDDLGARIEGSSVVEKLPSVRVLDRFLPRQVDVGYFNVNDDYQLGNEHAQRLSGAIESEQNITMRLPIVFTPDEAATVALKLVYSAWANRTSYSISLAYNHVRIDPADIIAVVKGASTFEMRVVETQLGANFVLRLKTVSEDSGVFSVVGTGADETGFVPQTIEVPGPTELNLLDIAMLREQDNDHGFYLTTSAKIEAAAWRGALVEKSLDAILFERLITTDTQPPAGFAQTKLADQTSPFVWDDTNTVDVVILNGKSLENKTDAQLLAFSNVAVVGNEVIQFGVVTQLSGNSWRLSRLLRGRFGSEQLTGSHVAGERFLLLSLTTTFNIEMAQSELNTTRFYRARSLGQRLDFPTGIKTFSNTGVRKKPLAAYFHTNTRPGLDMVTTWLRRSRASGPMLHDSPMFEDSENYEFDIIALDESVARTITTTPSANGSVVTASLQKVFYSQLDMAIDNISIKQDISFTIYQMSATVGRGYPSSGVSLTDSIWIEIPSTNLAITTSAPVAGLINLSPARVDLRLTTTQPSLVHGNLRAHGYQANVGPTTVSSSSTFTKIADLSFLPAANRRYMLLWTALSENKDSGNTGPDVRIRNTTDSITMSLVDFRKDIQFTSTLLGSMVQFTAGASPSAVTFEVQARSTNSGFDQQFTDINFLQLLLEDGNDGDKYAEDNSTQTTQLATYQDAVELSFTPDTKGDYLIFCYAELDSDSILQQQHCRLEVDGDNVSINEIDQKRLSATAYQPWLGMTKVVFDTTAHSIKIQFRVTDITTTTSIRRTRILALRLSSFRSHHYAENRVQDTETTTTYKTHLTLTTTPRAAPHIYFGQIRAGDDDSSNNDYVQAQLREDSVQLHPDRVTRDRGWTSAETARVLMPFMKKDDYLVQSHTFDTRFRHSTGLGGQTAFADQSAICLLDLSLAINSLVPGSADVTLTTTAPTVLNTT